jgi:hypothetical protein
VAIKDSADKWVRGKPTQAIIIIALVGVIVGGLVGLGVGFKIEQNRTSSDVKRLHAQLNAAAAGGSAGGSGGSGVSLTGPVGQRTGKITAVGTDSLTISTKRQGPQKIQTSSTTVFEKAVKGTTADIAVGRHVLVTIVATDVIVLPEGSKLGREVASVGSESFTLKKPNGDRSGQLSLTKVKVVNTLAPAKLSDFKVKDAVFAGGRTAGKGKFAATEVILLDPKSGFAD